MTKKPNISITTDGRVLTFEYHGHISASDVRGQSEQIEALRTQLLPQFTVLADLTELEAMDSECTPLVSHVMDQLNSMGAARVVRVIPDRHKDIGLGILSLFHYKRGTHFNTVTTRDEANRLVR